METLCDFANFAREKILVIREIRGEIPDSSSELLSFLNARIREFVGECGIAVKDAIYREFGRNLKVRGLRNFVPVLDDFYGVLLYSDGV